VATLSALEGKKPVEESAIAPEALTKVFCGHVLAATPLFFHLPALVGELIGNPLYDCADKGVCLFDGVARLVYE
jgi:hypothetical protein